MHVNRTYISTRLKNSSAACITGVDFLYLSEQDLPVRRLLCLVFYGCFKNMLKL